MKFIPKSKLYLWLITCCLSATNLSAQKQTEPHLDSLFLLMNSDPDRVIKLGTELYEKYKGNPKMEISILTIIGSSYSIKKDYETAIDYAFKTREISQKINDYPTQIQVAGFIGEKYHNLNINSKAKYYFDEAYDLIEKHPLPDSLKFYKGNLLFLKALIYRDDLGCEFAKTYYDRALEVYLPLLKEREMLRFSVGDIYNEKGFCFLEKNVLDSAKVAFETSLKYAVNGDYSLLNSESLSGLGRIHYLNKDYQKAEEKFNEVAKLIKTKNVENVNPIVFKFISDNYYALNDIENYTHYLDIYKQKTSSDISAKKKSVNEIIDKKTIQYKDEQENNTKYWVVISILLVALFILLAVVIFQISRTKQKIKKLKEEIPTDDVNL